MSQQLNDSQNVSHPTGSSFALRAAPWIILVAFFICALGSQGKPRFK